MQASLRWMIMTVTQITDNDQQLVMGEEFCVVEFYTPWCKPCVEIKDEYLRCSEVYGDNLKFYAIDCSVNSEFAKDEDVCSWPTFHFYKKGNMFSSFRGAPATLNLDPVVQEAIAKYAGA